MRFQLHITLTRECLKYQNDLLDQMETNFNQTRVRAHKVEPHFTIKYGFECSKQQLSELEEILDNLLYVFSGKGISVGGFGIFKDSEKVVLYTKGQPSAGFIEAYTHFYNKLKELPWLHWESYENPKNLALHSTLASGSEDEINTIKNYISGKEKYFEIIIERITLYKFTKLVNGIREYEPYKIYLID